MKIYLKNILIILSTISTFGLSSCKKDVTNIVPSATILFNGNNEDSFKMGTGDNVKLSASVEGAKSIKWDLGDGRQSENQEMTLSYPKSGTYVIKLALTGADNKTTIISGKVSVLDRLLKKILITKVYWNSSDPRFSEAGWPTTNSADIYVKIQHLQGNDEYINGFVPAAPIVYKSEIIRNITNISSGPIMITVPSNVVLDKALLDNRTYLISLIAKNTSGEYLLFSNRFSGANQLIKQDNIERNEFIVNTSFYSSIDLICNFE